MKIEFDVYVRLLNKLAIVRVSDNEYETAKETLLSDLAMYLDDASMMDILINGEWEIDEEDAEEYFTEDFVDRMHSFIKENYENAENLTFTVFTNPCGYDIELFIIISKKED